MSRCLLARAVLAGVIWIASGTLVHVDQAGSRPVQPSGIRARVPSFEAAQAWFEYVRAHEIGEWDRSAKFAAGLSTARLTGIRDDLQAIHYLLDAATAKRTTRVELFGRTLALASLEPLLGLETGELDLPSDLTFLGDPENPARRIISRVMIRAAMLHTRVAMEPVEDAPPDDRPLVRSSGPARIIVQPQGAVRVQDGQQTAIADLSMHWAIAREALDIVGPPPAASLAVRAWYEATSEYMQNKRLYNALLPQLEHARALFPNDATVFLLSGAAAENLAAPKVQAALDASSGVGKPSDLIRGAEKYLRRALELDPNSASTKLRLGRVLVITHHDDEAAQLLQAAAAGVSTPEARYLAALLLGRAEESRGHDGPARAAYLQAADLFARAQSPKLALASLSWRRGEQDEALSQLRLLSAVNPDDVYGDPWWRYDVCHLGDIDALFDRLDAAVKKALQ